MKGQAQKIALVTNTRSGCDEKNLLVRRILMKVRVFHQSLGFQNTILRKVGGVVVNGRARKLLW